MNLNLILKFIDGTKEVLPIDLHDEESFDQLIQDVETAFKSKSVWSYVDMGVDFANIIVYAIKEVVNQPPQIAIAPTSPTSPTNQTSQSPVA